MEDWSSRDSLAGIQTSLSKISRKSQFNPKTEPICNNTTATEYPKGSNKASSRVIKDDLRRRGSNILHFRWLRALKSTEIYKYGKSVARFTTVYTLHVDENVEFVQVLLHFLSLSINKNHPERLYQCTQWQKESNKAGSQVIKADLRHWTTKHGVTLCAQVTEIKKYYKIITQLTSVYKLQTKKACLYILKKCSCCCSTLHFSQKLTLTMDTTQSLCTQWLKGWNKASSQVIKAVFWHYGNNILHGNCTKSDSVYQENINITKESRNLQLFTSCTLKKAHLCIFKCAICAVITNAKSISCHFKSKKLLKNCYNTRLLQK